MKVQLEIDKQIEKERIILKTQAQTKQINEIVAYIEKTSALLIGKNRIKAIAFPSVILSISIQVKRKSMVTQCKKSLLSNFVYMNSKNNYLIFSSVFLILKL